MGEVDRDEVVADTHSIIWFLARSERLSTTARQRLAEIEQRRGSIYVSSFTLIEVRYHVEKGRFVLDQERALYAALESPETAMRESPVTSAVVRHLERVPRSAIPDPADRLIMAAAIELGVPLVTRDRRIRRSKLIECIW